MIIHRLALGTALILLAGCASLETRLDRLEEQEKKTDARLASIEKKLAAAAADAEAAKKELTDTNSTLQKGLAAAKEAADKATEAANRSEAAAAKAESAATKAENAAQKAARAFELGQRK